MEVTARCGESGVTCCVPVVTDDSVACLADRIARALHADGATSGTLGLGLHVDGEEKASLDPGTPVSNTTISTDTVVILTASSLADNHVFPGAALALRLSPCGTQLFVAEPEGRLAMWSVSTGLLLWRSTHPGAAPGSPEGCALAFAPSGRSVASAAGTSHLCVWDVLTGGRRVLRNGRGEVRSLCFTPCSTALAGGMPCGDVVLWDVASGEAAAVLGGHRDPVLRMVDAGAGRLISASADATLRVWDTASRECLATLQGHTAPVWDATADAGLCRAVSVAGDRLLRVWCLTTYTPLHCVTTPFQMLAVQLGRQGLIAGRGSEDTDTAFWDLAHIDTGHEARVAVGPMFEAGGGGGAQPSPHMVLSRCGRWIFIAGGCGVGLSRIEPAFHRRSGHLRGGTAGACCVS